MTVRAALEETAMASVRIDFFADLICPWCYVGWESLKRAAEARPHLRVSLSWRNFLLYPNAPAEGVDREAYLQERYGAEPEKLAASGAALRAAAEAAGAPINLAAAKRFPNTINAHRLVHWGAGQGIAEAMIDALFAAYFVEGRDIGDLEELVRIADSVGLDPAIVRDLLPSPADRGEILTLHQAAVNTGVTGVPVTILNRQAVLMGAETPEVYGEALDRVAA